MTAYIVKGKKITIIPVISEIQAENPREAAEKFNKDVGTEAEEVIEVDGDSFEVDGYCDNGCAILTGEDYYADDFGSVLCAKCFAELEADQGSDEPPDDFADLIPVE